MKLTSNEILEVIRILQKILPTTEETNRIVFLASKFANKY